MKSVWIGSGRLGVNSGIVVVGLAAICLAWPASADGQATPATEQLSVLVEGLRARSSLESEIFGEGVEETYFDESYIASLPPPPETRAGAIEDVGPLTADRGAYAVRFCLGPDSWRSEIQCLLWDGGVSPWGFRREPRRSPLDVLGLYARCHSQGGVNFRCSREPGRVATGIVTEEGGAVRGPMAWPFGMWLGFADYYKTWPEELMREDAAIASVAPQEPGSQTYVIERGVALGDRLGECLTWVEDRDGDLAVTRDEVLAIQKADPRRAVRVVHSWSEFIEVEGAPRLPTRYQRDEYRYPAADGNPWSISTIVTLHALTTDPAEIETREMFPVGSAVMVVPPDLPVAGMPDNWRFEGRAMHDQAERAAEKPLPPTDLVIPLVGAAYTDELTGQELAAIAERYGFGL